MSLLTHSKYNIF